VFYKISVLLNRLKKKKREKEEERKRVKEESNFCPVKAENKGFMPTNKQLTHQYITLNENKTKTQDYDLLNK
jgi:hypothetical protein